MFSFLKVLCPFTKWSKPAILKGCVVRFRQEAVEVRGGQLGELSA